MHIHQVFFWLKDNLTLNEISDFEKGLLQLTRITSVKAGFFGKPAKTYRDVVERSYSYGLTLHFGSISDHDQYQRHTEHQDFVAKHAAKWDKVKIFDLETVDLDL